MLQDDLDDFHAIVLHVLDLVPGKVCNFLPALLSLSCDGVSILQTILFDIVV